MKTTDLNARKVKVLELENDKLNAELGLRKKQDCIEELIEDIPKHACTEYFMGRLRGMDDEEEMRAFVEDQKFASAFGQGEIRGMGDEFDAFQESEKQQASEEDKKEILGSVRKGNLKIIEGGKS